MFFVIRCARLNACTDPLDGGREVQREEPNYEVSFDELGTRCRDVYCIICGDGFPRGAERDSRKSSLRKRKNPVAIAPGSDPGCDVTLAWLSRGADM